MDKDELLKYMPDYYNGVYEMEELLKAQSKGLYQFDEKINRTLLNEFIIQADEKGISVFENQYHITPDPSDTLEVRRQRLLMRVLPPQPITIRYLKGLFKSLKIPAFVDVDRARRKLTVISFNGELSREQQKLITLTLNCYLPANITYIYHTWYKCEPARAYVGSATACKVTTAAHAEILTEEQQRIKFYEFGIWQTTVRATTAYVGSATTSKVTASVEAERRDYE
ncbi:MAG: YmfQ family protein [Lactobacillus sp.]|uniref:putative phage tail protein n=1 Tax=Lactobacillus sp. TaxID=1591 RepID=UPI0026483F8B|nr:putative phage tail protein [Lactobacillus sp.]MDN5988586.1 YmfQ family protein [Lactobacillus sp.]MDN6007634.1 YmfQ family protein [Lactobacillus sp.]